MRIDGIEYCPNENEKIALDHINTCFEEVGVVIADVAVDRAHRIGRSYKNKDGKQCKSIIVKFNNYMDQLNS